MNRVERPAFRLAIRAPVVAASLLAFGVVRVFFHGVEADIADARPPSRPEAIRIQAERADWRELSLIPGVGDRLARGIAARLRRGDSLGELLRVPGVGPAVLDRLRPHVQFGSLQTSAAAR